MKIQYCSDLHLEFWDNRKYLEKNPLQPKGDILLLAGDIVPFAVLNKYNDFFSFVSDNFEFTYWLPGNHEYYYYDAVNRSGVVNEKIRSNVFLVNNVSIQHENVKFIFSTLWSHISPAYEWEIEKGMSDFHVIKYNGYRLSSNQYNRMHEECMQFLQRGKDAGFTGKTIVVTHHIPTFLNYPQQYKGDALNEAFAVELFDFIETSGFTYWLYGHHHTNIPEFKIGNTLLCTNQLGYVGNNEHGLFDTCKVID